jgi:pimeloyl-ACP methyl ester carboxylesterase
MKNIVILKKLPLLSSIFLTDSCHSFTKFAFAGFALFLFTALPCTASDDKRELNIAADIQKTLKTGMAVWLQTPENKFLSLYTQTSTAHRQGLIILLHDIGGNPDQELVIKKLRQFLPNHHWASLSVQMPLRESGALIVDYYALFPEAKKRLNAAIQFAKAEKAEKVVIVGYGLGALMATYALADKSNDVNGVVLISLPASESGDPLLFISNFNLPILDIYAELDISDVVLSARDRLVAGKNNSAYRQVVLENEGHQYLNSNDLLVKRVYSWVDRVVASQGLAGPAGQKGELGYKGAQGAQGAVGAKGDQGDTGSKGNTGIEGIQGVKGDQGIQGVKGDQGIHGDKGDQGIQGTKGETGPKGNQGLKGDQGIQGSKGNQGLKGETGPKGEQGIKGDQGIQGSKGDTGSQGEKGVEGDLGLKGDMGLKGDTGPKGDPGEKGDQGVKGDIGPKGNIGTKGDRGIKGDIGLKGDQGIQGDQGIKGDFGSKGDDGLKGDQGLKGDTGATGLSGN